MKLGVTGHQRISDESKWPEVEHAMRSVVEGCDEPIVGLSSLAAGADQRFAEIVLKAGGTLVAILPFKDYERTFDNKDDLGAFRQLLLKASKVETLEWHVNDEESFFAAGRRIADDCDLLVAIWNGQPAAGIGGTADVVRYAKSKGRSVTQINPDKL